MFPALLSAKQRYKQTVLLDVKIALSYFKQNFLTMGIFPERVLVLLYVVQ